MGKTTIRVTKDLHNATSVSEDLIGPKGLGEGKVFGFREVEWKEC